MKTLYALIGSLALMLALVASAPARDTQFGGLAKGYADTNRKLTPPQICRVNLSQTCVVCSSAGKTGILVSLDVSSGAVGGFAVALDTGALPSALYVPASSGAGQLIARQKTCEYTAATVDTNKGGCGVKQFDDGAPFSNGLTVCSWPGAEQVVVLFREYTLP